MSNQKTLRQASPALYRRLLILIVALFIVINAIWIWAYRHGFLLDIDEAGYLSLSILDYYGLRDNGLWGWITAIEAPSIQAPITTALSSLLYIVGGPHVILGFAVPLMFGAACVIVAYQLGQALGTRRSGLVAALLTASCPLIVNFSRSYQFSMPATLFTSLALLAIIRSRHFNHVGWTIGFGVCLGLMPLARTMTIAFLPGLIAAGFVSCVLIPEQRVRRLAMFAASLLLAVCVAATWLWPNGMLVAHYLFSFGYGAQALEYGPKTSKLGLDAWVTMAQVFTSEVYLPHFLLMLLGLLALVIAALWDGARIGVAAAAGRLVRSPVLPVVIVATEIILALTSSSNKGSGFFAPVTPILLALAAYAFERLGRARLARATFTGFACSVALVAAAPTIDLHTPFAAQWVAQVPVLGWVTVTQGRGIIQSEQAVIGYGRPGDIEPFDPATNHAWIDVSSWTAETIAKELGPHAIVAYGFRNAFYNINTINLQRLLMSSSAYGGRMISPTETGESVAGYLGWLKAQATDACALLTSDRVGGDFAPAVNRADMEEAARQAGFVPGRTWPIPDGQIITMWKHPVAPPGCQYNTTS